MAAILLHGVSSLTWFLVVVFTLVTLISFVRAGSFDTIEKPKFAYVEKKVVKITYEKGANRTLFICCTAPDLNSFLENVVCKLSHMSLCPGFTRLSSCKVKGEQVCCQLDRVIEQLTIKGYVAKIDGNRTVSSSAVATYVTNPKEKIPKSVRKVTVTTNANQGLTVMWTPLTARDYSANPNRYTYVVDCKPIVNKQAKAVRVVDINLSNSQLVIDSRNLTAVCKYRCCVQVVNDLSLGSELSCQNVTTTEKAPSSPPVIICGNDTACPSVIKGMQRNISLLYQLPRLDERNGKLVRHEIFYKNVTSFNTTKLIIYNGSATVAVITNAEVGTSYDVYMKTCTDVGCSPASNTVRIPAVTFRDNIFERPVVVIVASVASFCVAVLFAISVILKRRQSQQKKRPLEKVEEPKSDYANVENPGGEDDVYSKLDDSHSEVSADEKDIKDCTVVINTEALIAEHT